MDGEIAEEYEQFVASLGGAYEAPFDRVVATMVGHLPRRPRRTSAELMSPQPRDDGWELARRIDGCLTGRRAASFLRIGDGEGAVLSLGLDRFPALTVHCADGALRWQLGIDPTTPDRTEVLDGLHAALRGAEVIGLPDRGNVRWLVDRPWPGPKLRAPYGIASTYPYLERHAGELGLAGKTATSSIFNTSLLPYYGPLVRGREVGLVTCRRELVDALQDRLGAGKVALHEVPGRAHDLGTTGPTGHYPGRYRELVDELEMAARPGMLFLVAAGILGKVYCEAIRAGGGVAVDIGSVADAWAGAATRNRFDDAHLEAWRLVDARGPGASGAPG